MLACAVGCPFCPPSDVLFVRPVSFCVMLPPRLRCLVCCWAGGGGRSGFGKYHNIWGFQLDCRGMTDTKVPYQRRNAKLTIPVSRAERDAARRLAAERGICVSALVREVCGVQFRPNGRLLPDGSVSDWERGPPRV